MIQIVVYLQSLLRQVLFTHDIFGSVDPNIPRFYNVHVLIDANLLACLPESWSHYSFSDG